VFCRHVLIESIRAAIKLFGKNCEVTATSHDLTDEQMFSSLANENVKDDNPQEKMDVIQFAQKFLAGHPESCKLTAVPSGTPVKPHGRADQHVHGSVRCIAAFLGENNWPINTVSRYAKIATLPADIRSRVAPPTGSRKDSGHGIKPGELRQSDAVALADLTPAAQRAAVQAYSEGKIKPEELPFAPDTRKDRIRYAPSFIAGEPTPPGSVRPYTVESLATFLGMMQPDKNNIQIKFTAAFGAVELIEEGLLTESKIVGIGTKNLGLMVSALKTQRDAAYARYRVVDLVW
jgi:hypothetical protein